MTKRTKVWLVLPGGGVRGAFQAGFLQEFFESRPNLKIDRVYGTSIGAIIAPTVADNKLNEVVNFFQNLKSPTDVFTPWSLVEKYLPEVSLVTRGAAYKSVGVVSTVDKGITDKSVYDKCYAAAWDLMNKKTIWFTGESYIAGMNASAALPLAVPPFKYAGTCFIDGYIDELVPLGLLEEHIQGCEYKDEVLVLIVDCSTRKFRTLQKIPSNAFELMAEVASDATLTNCVMTLDYRIAEIPVPTYHIKPSVVKFDSATDFDQTKILWAIEHGRQAATQCSLL